MSLRVEPASSDFPVKDSWTLCADDVDDALSPGNISGVACFLLSREKMDFPGPQQSCIECFGGQQSFHDGIFHCVFFESHYRKTYEKRSIRILAV